MLGYYRYRWQLALKNEKRMKARRLYLKFTGEMLAEWKQNHRPRPLGYKTPFEYCKQLFKFDCKSVLHF